MGPVLNRDVRSRDASVPGPRLIEFARAVVEDQNLARTGIAQYLHDTLLQTLVVLSFATSENAGESGYPVADLIAECCRHARVVSSLLSTTFTGDGDLVELIQLVLENLKQDARIDVDFRFESPGPLPAELSRLIFDVVMEFVSVLILDRSTHAHTILFTHHSGWITLDLPAKWGNRVPSLSALSRLRTEQLGGCLESSAESLRGEGRICLRLPIELDESPNPDRR